MEENNELQPVAIRLQVVQQPGGVYRTYANNINLGWTAHDVRIDFADFSRISEHQPSDTPTNRIEERASITLAWTEAKALYEALAQLIHKFEAANGELKVPQMR
jgi:Protein of unknown function (DUF3467)